MPELRGTVAETYLLSRGKLGRQPQALRFYRSLKHHKSNSYWPALVSLIHGPDGKHCAVHRTWLAPDGHAKAPLGRAARMVLGPYAGGAIRIWRGAGGRPIGQAPPGSAVTLTEGIEDGLTVAVDELEAEADNRKVDAVVSLARRAAGGGKIHRGGADHRGVVFEARSCFLFSSINVPPLLGADRSRMAILALDTLAAYARALSAEGYDARGCDVFGTLLACANLALHDAAADYDSAVETEKGPSYTDSG